ncbi:MAG: sigma 54-interacting transcriptional regulator [Pyrinomonadaceae bacterium]
MKLVSPTELRAEVQSSETTLNIAERIHSSSATNSDRAALLIEAEQLAATDSIAATLETASRLLAELEISVSSLKLDRSGFITLWQAPRPIAPPANASPEVDARLADFVARTGVTTLEARYRGSSSKLAQRAVGAILHAAAIQAERLSRRAWRFAPLEEAEGAEKNSSGLPSEKARKLEADIGRVARFPHGILITGETGTGKTVSARLIHAKSARAGKPFVELNCAAMPEHLVEAELFGYRRGAFTGADRDHKGMFEEADGGILFLDEIGDIPPVVQNKLLKAIDEKQIKRLGTNQYVKCDVQIIAATSRDLRGMIREGSFREDLYCRLAVLRIEAVPLRERREDIPALIDTFLREAAGAISKAEGEREEYGIETGAVEMLCAHHWSGNIRVLRNTIFELTSYVREGETITMERTGEALAWLSYDAGGVEPTAEAATTLEKACGSIYSFQQLAEALQSLAEEGDIVLPLEVCVLRRGETLKQWMLRAKQCGIEAAWRASTSGKLREAAERLGLDYTNIKSQLSRTRSRLSEPRSVAAAK